MEDTTHDPIIYEFAPTTNYVVFLWLVLGFVQLGLLYIFWLNPWYAREVLDPRSRSISLAFWLFFDAFLIVGATHATRLRVRVDPAGIEYLNWNFMRMRMEWDEVTRFVCKTNFMGKRYAVWSGRRSFAFTTVAIGAAERLAALIVDRSDLDDLGEVALSIQSGTIHVWEHPSLVDQS